MTVNISGQVPGEQQNGLIEIEGTLLHERTPDPITAVVVIERAALKYNYVKQEWSATVRMRHIEPLTGERAETARGLLNAAYSDRTGETQLPIDEPTLDIDGETPAVTNEQGEQESNVSTGPWEPALDGGDDTDGAA